MRLTSVAAVVLALAFMANAGGASAQSAAGSATVAIDARLAGDDERTRLVIDLTGKVELTAFTLADPYRVIIDLADMSFDLPKSAGVKGRGLVSAFRYGLIAPGKARVVLDAKGPVAIDRSFVLDAHDGQPFRLVVDLVPTDRGSFIREAARNRPETSEVDQRPARADAGSNPGKPVIVIDPGHGGIDTGAIAPSGVEEKEVALAVATRLGQSLERTGRYSVVFTRADDRFVPLQQRVRVARENRAALFISIHADSISRGEAQVRGATVYTVSDRASDIEAARLAEKENMADMIAGVDLSDQSEDVASILLDLAHRETRNFSGMFARTLVGRMQDATRMHGRPLRSAGFTVLRAPDVPSVLLELGFLSNREDVRLLTSEAWRERVAASMVEAVDAFFAGRMAENSR
jgi:N-acetylmuramoyl-L-alanine amidase